MTSQLFCGLVARFALLVVFPMCFAALVAKTFNLRATGHGMCEECGGFENIEHSQGCIRGQWIEQRRKGG